MNPNEQLQLIRALEEREHRRRGAANWTAWIAVALAGLVLVVMIAGGSRQLSRIRASVETANAELITTQQKLTDAQQSLGNVEETRRRKEAEVRGLQTILDTLPDEQREALIRRTLQQKPATAQLVPRIYLHIVAEKDRPYANDIATRLRDAGFFVVGIQRVERAAALQVSDVRFYRKAEEAEAKRILTVLKAAGEANARTNHLAQYENTTTARPNHFEVWLARHSPER